VVHPIVNEIAAFILAMNRAGIEPPAPWDDWDRALCAIVYGADWQNDPLYKADEEAMRNNDKTHNFSHISKAIRLLLPEGDKREVL